MTKYELWSRFPGGTWHSEEASADLETLQRRVKSDSKRRKRPKEYTILPVGTLPLGEEAPALPG